MRGRPGTRGWRAILGPQGSLRRFEVEAGPGEEAADEAGPVLHPLEPGLHQRGDLADLTRARSVPGLVTGPVDGGAEDTGVSRRMQRPKMILTLVRGPTSRLLSPMRARRISSRRGRQRLLTISDRLCLRIGPAG